jgi:hypothetical protein
MERPETPKPEHWNDELQTSLDKGVTFARKEPKDWDWCDTLPPALKETIQMLKEENQRRAKRDKELDEMLNRLK